MCVKNYYRISWVSNLFETARSSSTHENIRYNKSLKSYQNSNGDDRNNLQFRLAIRSLDVSTSPMTSGNFKLRNKPDALV